MTHNVPPWFGTNFLNGTTHEIQLNPVRMFRDPFSLDPNKLVLCDCREMNGTPAPGNRRVECEEAMEAAKDQKPWFGFEQEFVLQTLEGRLFGWPDNETPPSASSQVGLQSVFGRDVSLSHYSACLYAGVKVAGAVGEAMPAQWEYQVGPCEGLELGDHVWMSRYILHRVCEDFGVIPSFEPKPLEEHRWGSGGHMNFSTESMRAEGGIQHIHAAIERLAQRHSEHMEVYGSEQNRLRLNGRLCTRTTTTSPGPCPTGREAFGSRDT
ncbi:hypothetical protein WMY93_012854 [Mugilogobius chulae]|uniref:Glutamine synthetase n=1 Tax=Mugilogobius chulae TaxID=88201 RepID=A0AAW0NYE5_9GOBI